MTGTKWGREGPTSQASVWGAGDDTAWSVCALEIDRDDLVELLRRLPYRRDLRHDAGVVDEYVHLTESVQAGLHQRRAVTWGRNVCLAEDRPPAEGFDGICRVSEPVLSTGPEDQVGTGFRQCRGKADSETGRSTGEDGHLSVQPESVQQRHASLPE